MDSAMNASFRKFNFLDCQNYFQACHAPLEVLRGQETYRQSPPEQESKDPQYSRDNDNSLMFANSTMIKSSVKTQVSTSLIPGDIFPSGSEASAQCGRKKKSISDHGGESAESEHDDAINLPKKRVTKAYSPYQKIQYVDLYRQEQKDRGRSFSQRQFARKHQLSHARFSAWCKEYDKLKSLDVSQLTVSRIRQPSARFPILEARVAEWIHTERRQGAGNPSIKSIQSFARSVAFELNINDFVASNTWIDRFRKRCDLNGFDDHEKNISIPPVNNDEKSNSNTDSPPINFGIDDNFSNNVQDSLVEEILQEFLSRSEYFQTSIEMAGLGLSNISAVPKLEELQVDSNDMDFNGIYCGTSTGTSVRLSESDNSEEPKWTSEEPKPKWNSEEPKPKWTSPPSKPKRIRHTFTDKQRKKYLDLYNEEKLVGGSQYSLGLFCERYKVSKSRMSSWLKQVDGVRNEDLTVEC